MNSRETAYLSLLASLREESFVQDYLSRWIEKEHPSAKDAALAREIAYGSAKMALTLDYIADNLSKGLSLKRRERALLRTALYQRYFMDRVPDYAIVNESVSIAKKYCGTHFAKLLNALLRKMRDVPLPEDESIRYSYPQRFVQKLIGEFGRDKAVEIMKIGNEPPVLMAVHLKEQRVERVNHVEPYAKSTEYYIQNETPFHIIQHLKKGKPKRILDLCSSPGGKLIEVHHLYPEAELFANDVSEAKMVRLRENLQKYGIKAHLTVGPGEEYPEGKFDLILLDVPCSNSGVLRKRPEARWRLNEGLHETQQKLFEHALKLATGEIWYMTCSIFKDENEGITQKLGKKIRTMKTFLPTFEGADGGFGCAIDVAV